MARTISLSSIPCRDHGLRPPSQLLALEPRYLFDAAALVTAEAVPAANAAATINATDESYASTLYSIALKTAEDTPLDIPAFVLTFNDGGMGINIDSIAAIPGETHGTVELLTASDGSQIVHYTPDENYTGEAKFTYTITNDLGTADSATVTLAVTAENDAPTTVGIADLQLTTATSSTVLDLTSAFSDIEDSANALTYTVASNSNAALFDAVVIDSTGQLNLGYTPNTVGDATLVIRATDSGGKFVESAFAITVTAAIEPPGSPPPNPPPLPDLDPPVYTPPAAAPVALSINDTTAIYVNSVAPLTSAYTAGPENLQSIDTTNILGSALKEISAQRGDTSFEPIFFDAQASAGGQQYLADAAAIQRLIAQGADPSDVTAASAAGGADNDAILLILRQAAQFLHCAVPK